MHSLPNRPGRAVGVAGLGDAGKFDVIAGINAGLAGQLIESAQHEYIVSAHK